MRTCLNPAWAPLISLVFLLAGCGGAPAGETAGIGADELREHLEFLASDGRAGRFPGTPGIAAAEEYIVSRYRELGLENPPGFEGFYDGFELEGRPWDFDSRLSLGRESYSLGADFAPLHISGEGELEAGVVFAGYGIEADEYGRHDYRDLDAEGRLVLAFRHEPEEKDPDSRWNGTAFTAYATFLSKARLAREKGAAGFLTFTDPLHHEAEESFHVLHSLRLPEDGAEGVAGLEGFPALIISRGLARELLRPLLEAAGLTLEELQLLCDRGEFPAAGPELPSLKLRLLREKGEAVAARNTGALYRPPGGGAAWTVIVGAHHDHLGGSPGAIPGRDGIFNGADDNASGVSALLEIAEELALRRPPLPFSVLFLTFSAEEAGLLGSRSLSSRLPPELAPFRLMLNLDMVGRNPDRPAEAFYSGLDENQLALLAQSAERAGLDLKTTEDSGPELSDQAPFRDEGIPTLFFFTGFHEEYHRPEDEAELISYPRLKQVAETAVDFLLDRRLFRKP
jgi:Peptidase family M28